MSNRTMVKLIHADGFYKEEEAINLKAVLNGINFTEKPYGFEVENFNLILQDLEPTMSKVLGEKVVIDHERSGIFRKPKQFVHFENFDTLNEWCFIVALEKTTFNMFDHLKNGIGENGEVDAKSALDGWNYNFRNLMEWNITTNVTLERNQGVFFRPWMFHSLDEGKLVQYYRLLTDKSLRILITGLPTAYRNEIAKKVHERCGENSVYINSLQERISNKDIDFSNDGQIRHAYRMLKIARGLRKENVVIDMTCPTEETRKILNPDIVIWIDTEKESGNAEVDALFQSPKEYDLRFKKRTDDIVDEIVERINTKRI